MSVEQSRSGRGTPRKKRKYLIIDVSAPPAARSVTAQSADPQKLDREELAWFSKSRHELIAELAYYKAERRDFEGGDSDRDWYEAELEVEELLRRGRPF